VLFSNDVVAEVRGVHDGFKGLVLDLRHGESLKRVN
jgi:hypothetical protein